MTIKVDNLYQHADGGYYCVLSDDAPMKNPTTGGWLPGVIYLGTDGRLRCTSRKRWLERFAPVAEYTGDDESVIAMIRRANPGSLDFDFVSTLESWHESEMGITGHSIELAIAATLLKLSKWADLDSPSLALETTITTEDLQRVVQTYEIERVPVPGGFRIIVRK